MALLTVIRIFMLTIFFNAILPTGDVYSDIVLMVRTWTYQNSESLEMAGCKACFGKTEQDLYAHGESCETCVTQNPLHKCGGFISTMNKFLDNEYRKDCKDAK